MRTDRADSSPSERHGEQAGPRRRPRTGGAAAHVPLLVILLLLPGIAGASALARGEEVIAPEPPGHPDVMPAPSPFLLEETRVRTVITGPVAHVTVTQQWRNPNTAPVDGLYIFPLPEEAAVTDMSLRIGERLVRGEMKRREEARAAYERARREGRVAGLLDQERPNVFAQQVANIMPGMSVEVILEMDHPVRCEASSCEYVFPTVVGPRFIPADQSDPGRIAPPVVAEGEATGQKLGLSVEIDAGVTLHRVESPSHAVKVVRRGSDGALVTLDGRDSRRLDRDFRLRYTVGSDRPEIGVMAWRDAEVTGGPGHFTLVIQPPAGPDDSQAAPRELVFVLDCSGSMSGVPIEAAKNVVRKSLRAVRPGDTFQIIRFSEAASGLSARPLPATPENVRRALAYLESLRGSGGTQMIEGIRAALATPEDPGRMRIVAFLTDGYIGNEGQILAEVRRLIGSARLFSFGIGSSVNRYLLEGLAEEGRGMAAFMGPRESPDEMVDRFVNRIDMPVLTDIRLSWEDLEVQDLEPARIPDLFAGRSVLVHGRYSAPGTGVVIVEGRSAGRWETYRQVAVFHEHETDHEALGRLWARARIHRLERELHAGADPAVEARITDLGLRHRLMTRWTSLVAVDSEISNLTGGSAAVNVPVEMPEDVSYEGVFGVAQAGARKTASGLAGSMRSLGYLSQVADRSAAAPTAEMVPPPAPPAVEQSLPPRSREEARSASGRDALRRDETGAAPLSFSRIDLYREDGSRVVVEADGEIWLIASSRRTLVRTLTTRELGALALAVASSGLPGGEDRSLSGPRLVVRGEWGRASVSLETAGEGASALAALIERMISASGS